MEVFDAVKTVLAVRKYQDKPVPAGVIRKVAEAAWLSASSMNAQPWHFIIVEDKELLKKIGAAAKTGPYVAQAAFAIVVAVDKNSKFGLSDASRAIQSMVLTAWAEGVGSNWVGFMGPNEVKPLVGIPESMDLVAIIPFGYPAQPAGKGKKNRKPFGEVVYREKFGQPFK